MRLLGIDFGSRRIGLALSDEDGRFAFPYEVVPNTSKIIDQVGAICTKEGVEKIIIGKSLNYKNQPNEIMKAADDFAAELGKTTGLPIDFEPEFMTSIQATHDIGADELLDARAAALILKSYIDRHTQN